MTDFKYPGKFALDDKEPNCVLVSFSTLSVKPYFQFTIHINGEITQVAALRLAERWLSRPLTREYYEVRRQYLTNNVPWEETKCKIRGDLLESKTVTVTFEDDGDLNIRHGDEMDLGESDRMAPELGVIYDNYRSLHIRTAPEATLPTTFERKAPDEWQQLKWTRIDFVVKALCGLLTKGGDKPKVPFPALTQRQMNDIIAVLTHDQAKSLLAYISQ